MLHGLLNRQASLLHCPEDAHAPIVVGRHPPALLLRLQGSDAADKSCEGSGVGQGLSTAHAMRAAGSTAGAETRLHSLQSRLFVRAACKQLY